MSRSSRVLLVDDDQLIRDLVSATLGSERFDVRCAPDGEEGLAIAREWQPAVVVLDVTMPGLDGITVCASLKSDVATKHIPVLMLTGRVAFDDRARGESAGADAYLTKPFSPFTLLRTVEHLLELGVVGSRRARQQPTV